MTLNKAESFGIARTQTLLKRLIEVPDLARAIQALPAPSFAALIRKVGLEDTGELVALATIEQLVHAFDHDLFVNEHAGERESFDVGRFAVWLEILLEAGDDVAADRVAQLDEDFVAHALSGLLLVLQEDELRQRLDEAEVDESRQIDKVLESALTEDLDGYVLIARQSDGWDAALSLLLALDRTHHALLVRLLDRLARVGSSTLDDLDELSSVLSEGDSLAEDVEAAREDRLSRQGYVEPQAARAYLALAAKPLEPADGAPARDPLTRAYFRELQRSQPAASGAGPALGALPPAVELELREAGVSQAALTSLTSLDRSGPTSVTDASSDGFMDPFMGAFIGAFIGALHEMSHDEPLLFRERVEELAYLTNVLLSGHERDGTRLRPSEAAEAVFATVCYGAVIQQRGSAAKGRKTALQRAEVREALLLYPADVLFRIASSTLAAKARATEPGAPANALLYSAEELEAALR